MKKHFVAALVLIALGGCSTRHSLGEGIQTLRGRSIQGAMDVLGIPSSENVIGGQRVLIWTTPHLHCRLTLTVDRNGTITGGEWMSRGLGCEVYEDRVNHWLKAPAPNSSINRNGDWYYKGTKVVGNEPQYKDAYEQCNRKVGAGAHLTDSQWQNRKSCITNFGYDWVEQK